MLIGSACDPGGSNKSLIDWSGDALLRVGGDTKFSGGSDDKSWRALSATDEAGSWNFASSLG